MYESPGPCWEDYTGPPWGNGTKNTNSTKNTDSICSGPQHPVSNSGPNLDTGDSPDKVTNKTIENLDNSIKSDEAQKALYENEKARAENAITKMSANTRGQANYPGYYNQGFENQYRAKNVAIRNINELQKAIESKLALKKSAEELLKKSK